MQAACIRQEAMSLVNLTVNFAGGNFSAVLPASALHELDASLLQLLEHLRTATSQSGRRIPQPATEYRYSGEIFLEVFCNPNLWPSPFAAKVLVTLRASEVRLSVEVDLSQLREDVHLSLQAV
ncbi:hypothetical protein GKIL_2982 [Gloeobacter kilaueensis JS1]|uniref:Uncharacterized protein n=2 Tax=Gloeobacter TaxID=33071 RepID=U5QK09_GLOK1|nr:hypothetical protein GKIL_2982 [Gloeobacter kilaueensis JS1]